MADLKAASKPEDTFDGKSGVVTIQGGDEPYYLKPPRLPWYKRLWYWLRRKPLPVQPLMLDVDASKPIGEAIDDKHIRLHF